MKLKCYTPYVKGITGHDFKLSLVQRFKILFCKRLSVIFANETFRPENKKSQKKKEAKNERLST